MLESNIRISRRMSLPPVLNKDQRKVAPPPLPPRIYNHHTRRHKTISHVLINKLDITSEDSSDEVLFIPEIKKGNDQFHLGRSSSVSSEDLDIRVNATWAKTNSVSNKQNTIMIQIKEVTSEVKKANDELQNNNKRTKIFYILGCIWVLTQIFFEVYRYFI